MPQISPPNVGPTWPAWRIASSPLCAGLRELDSWSLEDLADANEFLDAEADAKAYADEIARSMPSEGVSAGWEVSRAVSPETQAEIDRVISDAKAMQHRNPAEVIADLMSRPVPPLPEDGPEE